MPELESIARLLEGLESKSLAVHAERCVRVRHRSAVCQRCATACSAAAIQVEVGGEGLSIDPDLCTGCGSCVTVCPTAAFEAIEPSSGEMLAAGLELAKQGEPVVYACARALKDNRTGGVVSVACLGRVDETVLVGLRLAGVHKVGFVAGPCEGCPDAAGIQVTHSTAASAADVCRWFGAKQRTIFLDGVPQQVKEIGRGNMPTTPGGFTRRGFLDELKNGAQNMAYDIAKETVQLNHEEKQEETSVIDRLHMNAQGIMDQHVVARRERLLDYLDRLGTPLDSDEPTRLWGRVEVDTENCDACLMCTVFCPTGALYRDEDSEGLEFLATDCTGCRLCETACFKGFLKVHDVANPAKLIACEVEHIDVKAPPKGDYHTLKIFNRKIL